MSALLILLCFARGKLCARPRGPVAKKSVRQECVCWASHCCQDYCPFTCELWMCLCVVSCVGALLPVAEASGTLQEIQKRLSDQKKLIQLSMLFSHNGTYYTPSYDEKCISASMVCYILELEVVVFDAKVDWDRNWYDIRNHFLDQAETSGVCPTCEVHEERSTEVFLESFETFLKICGARSITVF